MQLLDVETQGPSTWKSPRKCAFVIVVVSFALLAGVFVAGFFTGKSLTTFTTMMSDLQNRNKSANGGQTIHNKWQDAVCSLHRPSCPWSESEGKAVVLISLDGFRTEYLTRNLTPSILTLAECGVTTPYMRASYPTKTFPNHYTIVTGLFPESHGIIDNTVYDPVLNRTFKVGSKEMYNAEWWIGEPVWETVQKQGKRSGTYFWPGSDVQIHGMRPTFSERYNRSVPFEIRIDQILTWLSSPSGQRPHLLTVYLEDPDRTGHIYGPVSSQITDVLPYVDSIIDRLMTGLQNHDILGCVNVIIVSDHGMAPVNCTDEIFLNELTTSSHTLHSYRGREGESPRIQPDPPLSPEELQETINELNIQTKSACFYDKYKLPKRYHYANSPRIEPIVIDLQEGWRVYRSNNSKHKCEGGAHGYDNLFENMRAIFVASGPSLKQHFEVQPFLNVEVYNLLCDLVGVVPSPNNGTEGSLQDALLVSPLRSLADTDAVTAHAPFCQYVIDNDPPVGCNVSNAHTTKHDNEVENNAPWGVPAKTKYNNLCVIANEQYVLGYDTIRRMPAWVTFSPKHNVSVNEDEFWLHDGRAKAIDCVRFQTEELRNASVEQTPLFPAAFASDWQARYMTNAVPMYAKFKKDILGVVENKIENWVHRWGSLNVVMGPIWDYDGDSLPDSWNGLVIPSHYFVVITRCLRVDHRVEDCDESQLDNLSFILPHANDAKLCMDIEDHLLKHTASVRDVELATGFRFYADMHNKHSLLLRLKLPERLWPILE